MPMTRAATLARLLPICMLLCAAPILTLYAARDRSGSQRRSLLTIHLASAPLSAAIDMRSERLLISTAASLDVLDARTGSQVRSLPAVGSRFLTVAAPSGRIYVAGSAGIDMRSADGSLLTTLALDPNAIGVDADARAQHVFVVTPDPSKRSASCADGSITMLDSWGGRILHTAPLGPVSQGGEICYSFASLPHTVAIDQDMHRLFAPSWTAYQKLPAGTSGMRASDGTWFATDALVMVDTTNGAFLRRVALPGSASTFIADERTHRVFVINDAGITVLDAATGQPIRTLRLSGSALFVDRRNGQVWLLAYDPRRSSLYVLDGSTGTLLRRVALPFLGDSLVAAAADEGNGRLFLLLQPPSGEPAAHVEIIDASRGTRIASIPAGEDAPLMLFDERTSRLFILARGSVAVPSPEPESWWRRLLARFAWYQARSTPSYPNGGTVTVIGVPK